MPPVPPAPKHRLPPLPWLLAAALALAAPACQSSDATPAPIPPDAGAKAPRTPAMPGSVDAVPEVAPDTVDTRAPLPEGFLRLGELAPEIAQEMRYATAYNFIGEPINGYRAGECILAVEAAVALDRVARTLARDGLGLKVYDCYRPQTAVTHFARWTGFADQSMKEAFYPAEPKGSLFSRGYISTRSGHSRGATVDLTLVRLPASASVRTTFPTPDTGLARCDRPRGDGGRLDEGDLDMGTAYDCFTDLASTDSGGISAAARRNRDRLRSAMRAEGFVNYAKEWWHFSLRDEPHPRTYFDFPVE